MSTPYTAPYGSGKSPITSDLIVAQSIAPSEVRLDGENIYWLEGRPQEQGRLVVARADGSGGNATDMTAKPYSARTRVHEYGGGSWTVPNGILYFSSFGDGRLYRQSEGALHPDPLTPAPPARERQWRFADGVIDHRRQCWIGIREDHMVARTGSHRRTRFLCFAAAVAGRPRAHLACLGPSQHAVERHHTVSCRVRPSRARERAAGRRRRRGGVDFPARMVARRQRRKGNPVGYFLFAGEQHGFRKAANIQLRLDAELAFYAIEAFKIGLTF